MDQGSTRRGSTTPSACGELAEYEPALAAAYPWLIVMLLAGIALAVYQTPVRRTEWIAQWFTPTWETRASLHLERIYGGAPLAPEGVRIDGDAFVIDLDGGRRAPLRWDPAVPRDSPVLFWTCGQVRFQEQETPLINSVHPEWLPPVCRDFP